jgi:hypothetical protein
MNPNLMEQFLGPSTQFFRFNSNDISVVVTPIEKKTCLLTKRNVIATTSTTSAATVRATEISSPVTIDVGFNRSTSASLKPQKSFVSSSNGNTISRAKCKNSSHAQLNDQQALDESIVEQTASTNISSNSDQSITTNSLTQSSIVKLKAENGETLDRDEQFVDDDECSDDNEDYENQVESNELGSKSEDSTYCLIDNHRKSLLAFEYFE